ncbi:MAG: hypothetical protein UD103_07795 [Bacteroidales bacterium]|nr:hypothetical protein [Bacteroidales bacterium]
MEKEKTACTGGGKCPLRFFCEYFRNHELKNTKTYFMAEFDAEKGMCKNYKQLK